MNVQLKFVCKTDHNGFVKGHTYPASIWSLNGLLVFKDDKDDKEEFIYTTIEDSALYVRKWFWTMEEWREQQLKEIGI